MFLWKKREILYLFFLLGIDLLYGIFYLHNKIFILTFLAIYTLIYLLTILNIRFLLIILHIYIQFFIFAILIILALIYLLLKHSFFVLEFFYIIFMLVLPVFIKRIFYSDEHALGCSDLHWSADLGRLHINFPWGP